MGPQLGFILVGAFGVAAIVVISRLAGRSASQVSLAAEAAVAPVAAPSGLFERQRQRYGPGQCARGGCSKTEGWLCSYRGPNGERCGQRWCSDHIEFVGKVPYCHRHTGVVRALAATAGTIKAVKTPPELDDRAVPLLTLISGDLDADFVKMLRELYSTRRGVEVAARSGVQEVRVDGVRAAWQRTWGAYDQRGYLSRIFIRVGVAEPPVVQAVVGDEVVFQSVPPWILRRLAGQAGVAGDRTTFRQQVVEAVMRRLEPVAERIAEEDARLGVS